MQGCVNFEFVSQELRMYAHIQLAVDRKFWP